MFNAYFASVLVSDNEARNDKARDNNPHDIHAHDDHSVVYSIVYSNYDDSMT